MYLGSWKINDWLTFAVNTHTASTGAATDADAVPTYRVYEDETATPILTGSMAKLDDAGTTGFYSERIQLTAANGFETGKSYTIYISATVGSIVGTLNHTFQMQAEVALHADWINGGRLDTILDAVAANLLLAMGATFATGTDSQEAIRDALDAAALAIKGATFDTATDSLEAIRNRGDAAWTSGTLGSGAISWTYTLTTNPGGLPIADATIWATTDIAGLNVVAQGVTDSFGKVTFNLDAGTYYIWRKKAGVSFTDPDTEVVA